MLRLLNTKDDLLPGAILYLRVYFLGMPALALYNFGNAVFSAIGDTKKPLMYLSIAGALNIALNLFFVIVCQLSVMGVALASAISQCASAGLILHALTKVQDCYVLDTKKLHLDPPQQRAFWALVFRPVSRMPFSPLQTCSFRQGSTPSTLSWSRATAPPPMPMP